MEKLLTVKRASPGLDPDMVYAEPRAFFRHVMAHNRLELSWRNTATFFFMSVYDHNGNSYTAYDHYLGVHFGHEIDLGIGPVSSAAFWDDTITLSSILHHPKDTNSPNVVVYMTTADTHERRPVAVYFPNQHLLAAVDFVHDTTYRQFFMRMMEALGIQPEYPEYVADGEEGSITWGADPEFEVWDPRRGRVVYAADVIGNGFSYPCARIGLDGAQDVAELRYSFPLEDPEDIVRIFYETVRDWEDETGYRACLSGHEYPIGCHVHIGAPDGYALEGSIHRAIVEIDRRVGYVLGLSGRARGLYRERAAYETKVYGFEYRTPPSAILADYDTAVMFLKSIQRIIDGGKAMWGLSRKLSELRELVESGEPFGLDCEILEREPCRVICDPGFDFSATFRAIAGNFCVSREVQLFGYARERGLITNCPSLARAMGWGRTYSPGACRGGWCRIGLPWEIRVSENTDDIITLLENVVAEVEECA